MSNREYRIVENYNEIDGSVWIPEIRYNISWDGTKKSEWSPLQSTIYGNGQKVPRQYYSKEEAIKAIEAVEDQARAERLRESTRKTEYHPYIPKNHKNDNIL